MSKQEQGKSEKPKAAKSDYAESRKLWKQSPEAWVQLLNMVGAERVQAQGPIIKLCCPYHPDTNPSGTVHLEKGYFKCHACNQFCGDPVRFLARYLPGGYPAALQGFVQHFSLEKKIDTELFSARDLLQKRAQLLNEVCYSYLCDLWVAHQMPETAKKNVAWLKTRGIHDVQGISCLGMLPRINDFDKIASKLQQRLQVTADDIKWAKNFVGSYFNTAYTDCIVYTYATAPDHITAFKLRPPQGEKDDVIKILELEPDGELGAFGVLLPNYYPMYENPHLTRFIAVEGEHDQLALYCGQVQRGMVDEVVIGINGKGHRGLSFMKELGFTECRLVGDDDAAGRAYPASVFPKTKGINFEVFDWPQFIKDPQGGKQDPADAVKAHGFDPLFNALCVPGNYLRAIRWCVKQAEVELQGVHPDNVVAAKSVVTKFAGFLTDDAEKHAFAEEIAKLRPNLNAAQVVRNTIAQADNALGFTMRVEEWFKKVYEVKLWNQDTNELSLWHFKRSKEITLQLDNASSITRLIGDITGGCLVSWVKNEVGFPGYLPDPFAPEATESALSKCEDAIEKAIKRALRRLTADTPQDITAAKGQGIHLDHTMETGAGYIVNGNRVFKVVWDENKEKLVRAEQLAGPKDGNHIFNLTKSSLVDDMEKGWTGLFLDARDLLAPPPISKEKTFQMVHELIDSTFSFEYQRTDSLYCAGLVFYNYIYDIFKHRRMLTHLTAEFASGKSSLLSITSNHMQIRELSLCDHAYALDTFTLAGFYQLYAQARLVAVLDEMNDNQDGSRDSEKKRTFYMHCRTLATSGEARISQGTQTGQGRHYILKNSVITASGTPIYDPMDESRFNTIYLKKDPSRGNVRAVLQRMYEPAAYQALRQSIFLHALNLAPKIHAEHGNIFKTIKPETLTRTTENLLPMAAILSTFGQNGLGFINEFLEARSQRTAGQAESTQGHTLLDLLLNSHFPFRDGDSNTTNIKTLLLNANTREKINETKTGIYYDAPTQSLAIVWREVCAAFRKELQMGKPHALMSQLKSTGDWIVDHEKARADGVFQRLQGFGVSSHPALVSVVSVREHIIDRVERARAMDLSGSADAPAADDLAGL